jgi:hypothetical protein
MKFSNHLCTEESMDRIKCFFGSGVLYEADDNERNKRNERQPLWVHNDRYLHVRFQRTLLVN